MSFTYNNQNCESFGLYVENYPTRPTPEKLYNTYQVPGLSGKIFVPQGSYANVIQPYDVFVKAGTPGMQKRIADIAAWLLTPDEPKDLTDTYDTTALRKAVFLGGNDWANSLNKFGRCTLNFDCGPQRYDRIPQTQTGEYTAGATGGFIIGTGLPKGDGYIDDIIPLIEIWASAWTVPSGEALHITITNPITSEVTTLVLTCTATNTDRKIVIDLLRGIIYVQHKTTTAVEDVLTYYSVTMTGTLKRRFTYQCDVDLQSELVDIKYLADPRWYRL